MLTIVKNHLYSFSFTESTSTVFLLSAGIDRAFSPGRPGAALAVSSILLKHYTETPSGTLLKLYEKKKKKITLLCWRYKQRIWQSIC